MNLSSPPRLVLAGCPGAGKGRVAELVRQRFPECEYFSTGDYFLARVAERDPLGASVDGYVAAGELVPDPVVIGVVGSLLAAGRFSGGFVFDGFPRTAGQVEWLAQALAAPVDAVVWVDVPREVAVHRLATRIVCRACGSVFNLVGRPPRVDGVCDRCGAALARRIDDDLQTVARRMTLCRERLEPLLDRFAALAPVMRLDGTRLGEGCVDQVLDFVRTRRAAA